MDAVGKKGDFDTCLSHSFFRNIKPNMRSASSSWLRHVGCGVLATEWFQKSLNVRLSGIDLNLPGHCVLASGIQGTNPCRSPQNEGLEESTRLQLSNVVLFQSTAAKFEYFQRPKRQHTCFSGTQGALQVDQAVLLDSSDAIFDASNVLLGSWWLSFVLDNWGSRRSLPSWSCRDCTSRRLIHLPPATS